MTDLMILLADTATKTAADPTIPSWGKYVLGPLGCLVLLLVYAIYTEKYRIPKFEGLLKTKDDALKEARDELSTLREQNSIKREEIRDKAESREDDLEAEIRKLQAKVAKEKSARAWWQAKATGAFKRLDEELSIPEDIDKTHYGGDG